MPTIAVFVQKSHEIVYMGRDRPGQLHSLYQASVGLLTGTSSLSQACWQEPSLAVFIMSLALLQKEGSGSHPYGFGTRTIAGKAPIVLPIQMLTTSTSMLMLQS